MIVPFIYPIYVALLVNFYGMGDTAVEHKMPLSCISNLMKSDWLLQYV